MAHLLAVNLKVANFEKWKASFDASVEMRKAAGEKSYQLFRTADDPNELVLLCEWTTIEAAQHFMHSDELRQAQQEAGVTQFPDNRPLELIDSGSF